MTEQKGFDHIYRQKKLKENTVVAGLRESEKLIGQLYPVLVDEQGNILDGQHRLKADPNWRKEVVKGVDSERKRAMIRLHANWHRRRTQPDQILEEIAKITEWKGAAPYAAFLGCSVRTVQRYLPQQYKSRDRTSKRQLSLSEEKNITPSEAEARDKYIKEENEVFAQNESVAHKFNATNPRQLPKINLLEMLANRLYNSVTWRTEPPEVLLKSPEIKESGESYLTRLDCENVSKQELMEYLKTKHEKQLIYVENHKREQEQKRVFQDKVNELTPKFKQIWVEFKDGTKLPINIRSLPYTGGARVPIHDKKYVPFYVKEIISGVVTDLLGFDKYGRLLKPNDTEEVELHE